MSNRLDQEFPQARWRAVPPIGPDGVQLYLERAQQARAEAFAYGLRQAAGALIASLRTAARFVRHAGGRIARRPPQCTYATTAPGRLTGR
jgi:hypothetical protein